MFLFLKLKQVILSWLKRRRGNKAFSQRTELLATCSQLTLDKFIRCIVHGDLSVLIVSGNPTQGELVETWMKIYYEYIELLNDLETKYFIFLQRDISVLTDEILNVESCLYFLSPDLIEFSLDKKDELIAIIEGFGYPCKIDHTSDNYLKQLKAIDNRLAKKRLDLNRKRNEFNNYQEGQQKESVDQEYFTRIFLRLSKYQGYPIKIKETTVYEYVILLRDYVKFIEHSKKEMEV